MGAGKSALFSAREAPQLSVDEAVRLEKLEREIKTGISTFVKVGLALAEIRDARLYRATHGTFEAYCRERWNLSRPRAYELMQAAAVAKSLPLSATADTTERALRPLAKLEPAARREVWAKAQKAAGDEPVTSKHVIDVMPKAAPQAAPPAAPTTEAEHERIFHEYERILAALVESAASGGDGMKRASAPQLKTLTKALKKLASEFGQLAELAPVEALSFYMQTRIDTLLVEKIEAARAAAPRLRCRNCDGVFPEYDLGTARECSRESCGASFVATDGENACPECGSPFTRLIEDNLCPECDDAEAVCEKVAEDGSQAEASA